MLLVIIVLFGWTRLGRVIVNRSLSTLFIAITLVLIVARLFIIKTRLALIPSLGTRSLVTTRLFTVALATLLVPVLLVRLLFIIATITKPPAVESLLLLGLVAMRAV